MTIDVIVSELGDVGRFHSAKAVCAYAGLVPGMRQSGDKRKELPITKAGSPLLRLGAGGGGVAGDPPARRGGGLRTDSRNEPAARRRWWRWRVGGCVSVYAMLRDGTNYDFLRWGVIGEIATGQGRCNRAGSTRGKDLSGPS